MYRITSAGDGKEDLSDPCATIDAAIVEARKLSKPRGSVTVVVRDEKGAVRVRAIDGRAHWVGPCKPCKGTGTIGNGVTGMGMFGGYMAVPVTCETCHGGGLREDLQCE